MGENNYRNKERFDKEFLNTSNNLYQFYLYVKRYAVYKDFIYQQLDIYNIPEDFIYLPIAESALRNDVVSTAGAWWIWQFMPETAKMYWLRVDDEIDERYHFEKATIAAMQYLTKLHGDFWNWSLAAAAYNRWENGLMRDMESQNIDNYYDLYLNEETSKYVFRILAIKYVMHSYFTKQDFINTLIWGVYKKQDTRIITVGKIDNLQIWATKAWYKYRDIKELNAWILWNSLPDGSWDILVLNI